MRDVRPFFTERYFLKKKIACFLTCKYNDNSTFEKCTEYTLKILYERVVRYGSINKGRLLNCAGRTKNGSP